MKLKKAHYIRAGLTVGLSKKETMLAPLGEILDLMKLYADAHGLNRENE